MAACFGVTSTAFVGGPASFRSIGSNLSKQAIVSLARTNDASSRTPNALRPISLDRAYELPLSPKLPRRHPEHCSPVLYEPVIYDAKEDDVRSKVSSQSFSSGSQSNLVKSICASAHTLVVWSYKGSAPALEPHQSQHLPRACRQALTLACPAPTSTPSSAPPPKNKAETARAYQGAIK